MKTVQLIISGRVQGVYFRAFTQKQAIKFDVTGFVRNRDDGSVEVIACAEEKNLALFISKCRKGPIMASVKNIITNQNRAAEQFTQFQVR